MRSIKFRGKSLVDNTWVYGYYISNDCGNHFIKEVKSPEGMICYREIEVNPDTVCEFTSLYDKHGKEIYEGDIIEAGNLVGVVEYFNGSFTFGADCPLCMLTVELKVVDNIYNDL